MKTLVISGGTRGIGKSIVKQFLGEGYRVFTFGSSPETVKKLKEEFKGPMGRRLHVKIVDATRKEEIWDWANHVISSTPSVDLLINNVGKFIPGSISQEQEGTFEDIIQTNLASAYHCTRAFLPQLKKQGFGDIFNMCSIASITAYPNGGSYCISKFAMLGFSKVLREEMKAFNIRVISVLPGATLTDSWAGVELPEGRIMPPEDISQLVWSIHGLKGQTVVEEIVIRPLLGDLD
ncbi:MAG TPA: SDR family oxidoreductase [Catalimonadaceae bacterium]|nr:SDR family oxidoreductase [Catalimonadaceae bacterium]